ncbi:hypothetical protein MRX96_012171 [Rhipicephalus microplus]
MMSRSFAPRQRTRPPDDIWEIATCPFFLRLVLLLDAAPHLLPLTLAELPLHPTREPMRRARSLRSNEG